MRGKTFQYLHVFKDAQGHRINVDRITAAEPQQSYLGWFEATGKTPPKASGRPRGVMPKQRFDRLKIASMNGSIVAFSVVSKVDPDWRMVTTLFPTANMASTWASANRPADAGLSRKWSSRRPALRP